MISQPDAVLTQRREVSRRPRVERAAVREPRAATAPAGPVDVDDDDQRESLAARRESARECLSAGRRCAHAADLGWIGADFSVRSIEFQSAWPELGSN